MQTATPPRFTKKIDNHPLKSGVHLQWEAEVDAFFYVRPEQMGRTPPWAKGLLLRADGYATPFYKKD